MLSNSDGCHYFQRNVYLSEAIMEFALKNAPKHAKGAFLVFQTVVLAVAKDPCKDRVDVFGVIGHVEFFVDFFDG